MSDFELPPPPAGMPPEEQPRARRHPRAPRRSVVAALILVMLGAAFALGAGVIRIVDSPDSGDAFLRSARGSAAGIAAPAAATERGSDAASSSTRASRFAILDEVYDVLDRDFVDPQAFESTDLRRAAINGIIDSLGDPYTAFIDAENYRLTSEDIGGSFEGIGCTVQDFDGEITIVTVFDGSPAERAGVLGGDVILGVDGESTEGWPLELAVQRIRGPAGTTVTLRVRRSTGVEEELPVVRDRIVVPSVRSRQINDREGNAVADIGYIRITQFTEDTREDLVDLLEAASNAEIDKLIIDLRNNPGGTLNGTIAATGEFIDEAVIMREIHRDGEEEIFRDRPGGAGQEMQLVILINAASASGSEVMAAALRDHGRAVLIGEVTAGKGTVNIPRRLSDGSVLYVSIARWISPDGTIIEGVGVIPDIEVAQPETGFEAEIDVQLMTAIDYLRGQWQPAAETAEQDDGASGASGEATPVEIEEDGDSTESDDGGESGDGADQE